MMGQQQRAEAIDLVSSTHSHLYWRSDGCPLGNTTSLRISQWRPTHHTSSSHVTPGVSQTLLLRLWAPLQRHTQQRRGFSVPRPDHLRGFSRGWIRRMRSPKSASATRGSPSTSTRRSPRTPSFPGRSKLLSRARHSGALIDTRSDELADDGTCFRAHKEVLWFASPFFQAALSGNWAETGRPLSMSSVITISQPPVVPGDKIHPDAPTAMTFAPVDPDLDPDELDIDLSESSEPEVIESSSTSTIVRSGKDNKQVPGSAVELDSGSEADPEAQKKAHEAARMESLEKLQKGAGGNTGKNQGEGIVKLSWKRGNAQMSSGRLATPSNPDAVIVLKEEKVRFFPPRLQSSSHRCLRQAPFMIFSDSSIQGTPLFPCQESKGCTWIKLTSGTAWNAQSRGTT